ncbi:MAG: arginase family protein [Leucobacter sp.]
MSKPVFLVMPEWQGSSSSRAMRLAEGAELLREDLPTTATREVPVPLEAGDAMGTPVARLSSVLQAGDAARQALREIPKGSVPVILGGDCASSLPGVEAAILSTGSDRVAVLWFDAHPDLQHPSTSPSGAASGMTLRHALGDGAADLAFASPVDPALLTLVGTRSIDAEESVEIERLGIRVLDPLSFLAPADSAAAELAEATPAGAAQTEASGAEAGADAAAALAASVTEWLSASGAERVYVHVDLDVLDPAEFSAVHAAVPFGLSVAQLTAAIRAAVATVPLAGAAICEFAPESAEAGAEDLPTVLRVLAALTSGPSA